MLGTQVCYWNQRNLWSEHVKCNRMHSHFRSHILEMPNQAYEASLPFLGLGFTLPVALQFPIFKLWLSCPHLTKKHHHKNEINNSLRFIIGHKDFWTSLSILVVSHQKLSFLIQQLLFFPPFQIGASLLSQYIYLIVARKPLE